MDFDVNNIKNASVPPPDHIWEALEKRLDSEEVEWSLPAIEGIQMLKLAKADPPSILEFKIFRRLETELNPGMAGAKGGRQSSILVGVSSKWKRVWTVAASLAFIMALWFLLGDGFRKLELRSPLASQITTPPDNAKQKLNGMPFKTKNSGIIPNGNAYNHSLHKNHLRTISVTIKPGIAATQKVDGTNDGTLPEMHTAMVSLDAAELPGIFGSPVSLTHLSPELPMDKADFWVAGFVDGKRIAIPKKLITNANSLSGTDSTNNWLSLAESANFDVFKEWWSLLESSNPAIPLKVYTIEYPGAEGRLESIVVVQ